VNKLKLNGIFLTFSTFLLFSYSGVIYFLPNYVIEETKLDISYVENLKALDALIEKAQKENATIPNEFLVDTLTKFKELEVDGNEISHKIFESYSHFNKAYFGILLIHLVAIFSFFRARKT